MKLQITRDQAKGMFGVVQFQLRAKVDLTPAENELVKRYKVEKASLFKGEAEIPFVNTKLSYDITIQTLISGKSFQCADIAAILATEETVKEACEAFKAYLDVMHSFGGEEVIEYT